MNTITSSYKPFPYAKFSFPLLDVYIQQIFMDFCPCFVIIKSLIVNVLIENPVSLTIFIALLYTPKI